MKKIGEILKSEREKKDLSLHEIGMSLKINPKILKAIEDADEKNLPAKTFLRGFIRSYAQYLRLDVEDILKQFQDEVGSTRPPEPRDEIIQSAQVVPTPAEAIKPVEQKPTAKKEKPLGKAKDENLNPSSSSRVLTILGAIVLVLLIAFVAKMVEKYQKETVHRDDEAEVTTTTVPAAPDVAAPAIADGGAAGGVPTESSVGTKTGSDIGMTSGSAAAAAGAPPKGADMMTPASSKTTTTTSSTTTAKATTTTVKATTTTTVKVTTTTIKAVVAVPKSTTTTTNSTSTTKSPTTTVAKTTTTTVKAKAADKAVTAEAADDASPTTTVPGKKSVEVIVEALNNVSINYTIGDGPAEVLAMTADEVHTFKGKGKVTLEISDGGAVSVIVNGRDRGVPGTIGQPLKLSYP